MNYESGALRCIVRKNTHLYSSNDPHAWMFNFLLSAGSGELMVRYHGSIKFLLGVPLIVILIDLLLRHPVLIGQYFL